MRPFTDKQQKYIEARAAGLKQGAAYRQAGFSPNGANVAASNLEKRPEVKAAIKAWKKKLGTVDAGGDEKAPVQVMKASYKSSLELMQHSYNNPKLPPVMRFEAAKQALPYEHARIGEKGKKESKNDDAKQVAKKPKFAANRPPTLKLVSSHK